MIVGQVNSDREAIVSLVVQGPQGQTRQVEAVTFDMFQAQVIWDGRVYPIDVDAADTTPLVGMGLMEDQELCIQVVFGGTVSIRALSIS